MPDHISLRTWPTPAGVAIDFAAFEAAVRAQREPASPRSAFLGQFGQVCWLVERHQPLHPDQRDARRQDRAQCEHRERDHGQRGRMLPAVQVGVASALKA